MAKDFKNKADVDCSIENQESGGGKTLKIPEGKTPVYFLQSTYEDGYVHWVEVNGTRMRVVCSGGLEGRGYEPEKCEICAYCAEMYAKAKQTDNPEKSDKIKKLGNEAHAKYEALFIAAKGEMIVVKEGAEKKKMADFEEAEVGILPMTSTQYQAFKGLLDGEKYSQVKSPEDLFNRAIMFDKAKRDTAKGKARYATVAFVPAKSQSDPPTVEWKPEDFPIADAFVIDHGQVKKAAAALKGGKVESKPAADVEYEDDEAVDDFAGGDDLDATDLGTEDTADADFLDDVEAEAPAPKKVDVKATAPKKPEAAKAPAKSKKAVPEDAEF